MFKVKESSKVIFKATKVFSVMFLFLAFSFSVVNAQDNNTTINEELTVTIDNEKLIITSDKKELTTTSNYDEFADEGNSSKFKGFYLLGQIGWNGATIENHDFSLGFTINGLIGYQYLSFLAAEGSLGFKLASYTDDSFITGTSLNYYAFDVKLYPLVFRYEFNLGGLSVTPRVGLGLGIAVGSLGASGNGTINDSISAIGITTVIPIGVTVGFGKFLVGLTVEPAFGTLSGGTTFNLESGLVETRVTVDIGYKF